MLLKQCLALAVWAAGALAQEATTSVTVSVVTGTATGRAATASATVITESEATQPVSELTTSSTSGYVTGIATGSPGTGYRPPPDPTSTISAYIGGGLIYAVAEPGPECSTVLRVNCLNQDLSTMAYCAEATNFGVPFMTFTAQATGIQGSGNISSALEVRSISVSCKYDDWLSTTSAYGLSAYGRQVCTATLSASISGLVTTTTSTVTSTQTIPYGKVLVTAGTYYVPNTATCIPTPATGAAAPTVVADVYKVLIPAGAAIAAGAALL